MKLIYATLLLVFCASCSSDQEGDVTLRLTSKERRQIDTLVTRQVKILRPRYDSICTAEFYKMVVDATDSIVQRRLEEEARLRARIPTGKIIGR